MILWMFIIICIIVVSDVVVVGSVVIVKFIIRLVVGDCDGLIILHSQVFFSVDHYYLKNGWVVDCNALKFVVGEGAPKDMTTKGMRIQRHIDYLYVLLSTSIF